MSFSFAVRAASKSLATGLVADEMEKVVTQQPVHEADHLYVLDTVGTYVDLVTAGEGEEISISVNGSVWATDKGLRSASIGVNVTVNPAR